MTRQRRRHLIRINPELISPGAFETFPHLSLAVRHHLERALRFERKNSLRIIGKRDSLSIKGKKVLRRDNKKIK